MAQAENLPAQVEERRPMTVRERLIQQMPEFAKALPGHIKPEKFVRTVQTAIQMNSEIGDVCGTPGGMQSLLAACTKAATDGLILDGREAALVTFNQKVSKKGEKDRWEKRIQYIPMVAGLMKKARNSGQIASITAHVVFSKDKFEYVLGDDERIEHQPCNDDARGDPLRVYAIVKLKDGSVQREVMSKADVLRIAAQSKNPDQYDPQKGRNFGEWWRKCVIRRISKYLPSSSDRDEFMQAVERIDEGFDFDNSNEPATIAPMPNRKKRGGAAAALSGMKDVTPRDAGGKTVQHDPDTGEASDDADEKDGPDRNDPRFASEGPQPGDDI